MINDAGKHEVKAEGSTSAGGRFAAPTAETEN
jgi:hypothetical protein